jgi:hypothetical protein
MSQGSFVGWLERDETVTAGADDFPARRRRLAPALMPRDSPDEMARPAGVAAGFLEVRCWMRPTGYTQSGRTHACAPTSSMLRPLKRALGGRNMRDKSLSICLLLLCFGLTLAGCNSHPNVSGVWKGSIQASEPNGKNKWNGPAELTLNQNGDALTGTLSFTHPQGGRVQLPISSGVITQDSVTFSGQNQFPMGSLELTFHGKVADTSLTGTADMTSRSVLIGPVNNTASLNLRKQ